MRWILLIVGITLHTLVLGQSTLKIYVANDDLRSDMDIIDINTSALDRYGQSVDSTNINFYATTMSTQVLRMSRVDLFGPEEVEDPIISDDVSGGNSGSTINVTKAANIQQTPSPKSSESTRTVASRSYSSSTFSKSNKTSRTKRKLRTVKKSRKNKRYRGQCPKFF